MCAAAQCNNTRDLAASPIKQLKAHVLKPLNLAYIGLMHDIVHVLNCCKLQSCIVWSLQDFSKEEKHALAIQSRKAPPKYGSEAKQQIIDGLHARMLASEQVALQPSLCANIFCLCSLQQPLPGFVWICCSNVVVSRPRAPQVELSLQHPFSPIVLEFRKLR